MATQTLVRADQLAALYRFHRSKIYRALDRRLVQPDHVAGRAQYFEVQSLSRVLDKLSSILSVPEYIRAKENLRLNGFDQEEGRQ